MRILLVTGKLYRETIEGTQKSVLNLANELIEHGHEVHWLTRSNHKLKGCPPALDAAVKIHRNRFDATNVFKLRKIVRRINPDIVNVHTRSAKMALFFKAIWHDSIITFPSYGDEGILGDIVFPHVNKTAVCPEIPLNMGFDAPITPYGIDTDTYRSTTPSDADDLSILFMGNPRYGRGFEQACEALSSVSRDFTFNVAVADKIGPREAAEQKLADAGIRDKAEIHGYIEDLPTFLNENDVLINLIPDCTGITCPPILTLEAMACGRTVVCSDIPEFTGVIDSGDNGYTAQYTDTDRIASIIDDLTAETMTRVGEHARQTIKQQYSKETSVDAFLKAYREVI